MTRDRSRRRRRRPRHVIVRRGALPGCVRVALSCRPTRWRRRSPGALRQRDRPTGEPCDGVGAAGDRQADKVTTRRNRRRSDARTIEGKYGHPRHQIGLITGHPTRAIPEPLRALLQFLQLGSYAAAWVVQRRGRDRRSPPSPTRTTPTAGLSETVLRHTLRLTELAFARVASATNAHNLRRRSSSRRPRHRPSGKIHRTLDCNTAVGRGYGPGFDSSRRWTRICFLARMPR